MTKKHHHEISPSWVMFKERTKWLFQDYCSIQAHYDHHQEYHPWDWQDIGLTHVL